MKKEGIKSERFESFMREIRSLCKKYSVQICSSGYDTIEIRDAVDGDGPFYLDAVSDETEKS